MNSSSIRQLILEKLSEALKIEAALIPNDAPFAEYGVDSIAGISLVRAINEALQIELDPAKLFEYSTVDQLSQHIWTYWQEQYPGDKAEVKLLDRTQERSSEPVVIPQRRLLGTELPTEPEGTHNEAHKFANPDLAAEPIAVIGMSGRFAESESLEEFWQKLKEGKHLVREVSRWRAEDCVIGGSNGHGYCSQGSFIDSIDQFDPTFSGYHAPKQSTWIRNRGCCWRNRGRRWKMPDTRARAYMRSNAEYMSVVGTPTTTVFSGKSLRPRHGGGIRSRLRRRGLHTISICKVPRWRWIQPVRAAWLPSIWHARDCGREKRRWPWRGECTYKPLRDSIRLRTARACFLQKESATALMPGPMVLCPVKGLG